jgi:hypothetical protein
MFDEMKEMHRKKTINEAMEILQFWRDIAAVNRKRVLGVLCSILKDGETTEDTFLFKPKSKAGVENDDKTKRAMQWLGCDAPLWYSVPSRTPRSCVSIPDDLLGYPLGACTDNVLRRPKYVHPLCECVMDDVRFYHDEYMVRFSGYTPIDHGYIVYTRGPVGVMTLVKRESNSVSVPETYDMVATESRAEYQDVMPNIPQNLTLFWEDGETNRLSRTVYRDLHVHPVLGKENKEELLPIFVRVSMRDSVGLVHTHHHDKKRMTGFCSDVYDFIQR